MNVFAIVKGTQVQAYEAAKARGLTAWGTVAVAGVTRLWLDLEPTGPCADMLVYRWMAETTRVPFPAGALLWYRVDADVEKRGGR